MSDPRPGRLPEDPSGIEEAHDVLAAEEFAMPTRSSRAVPPDPTGLRKPHDTLAAEEFAMPAGGDTGGDSGGIEPRTLLPGLALLALVALAVRRLRR